MSIYKGYSHKTRCMHFMIKDEKKIDRYIIWEKVSNIIKKINSELIYNKKYLNAEKRFNTRESFQCFYIPVILLDSVYRKDRNYYPTIIQKYF